MAMTSQIFQMNAASRAFSSNVLNKKAALPLNGKYTTKSDSCANVDAAMI